jgi:hypothetical protein
MNRQAAFWPATASDVNLLEVVPEDPRSSTAMHRELLAVGSLPLPASKVGLNPTWNMSAYKQL